MSAKSPVLAVVTDFHKAIVAAVDKRDRAATSFVDSVRTAITQRYGDTMPTHAEYTNDQEALLMLAKAKKLADNQHYRKVFAKAVKDIYGALPISLAPEAVTKRRQRQGALSPEQRLADAEVRAANKGKPEHVVESLAAAAIAEAKGKKQPAAGAPAGVPKDQAPSAAESIEQMIARIGVAATLQAVAKILKAEAATATQAKTLDAIAKQVGVKAA